MSRDSSDTEAPEDCYQTYADIIANKAVASGHGDDLRALSKRAFNAGDMHLVKKCEEFRRSASGVQQSQRGMGVTRSFSTGNSWLASATLVSVGPSRSTLRRTNTSETTLCIDPVHRVPPLPARTSLVAPFLAVLPRLPGITPFASLPLAPHRVHAPPPLTWRTPALASTDSRTNTASTRSQQRRSRLTAGALPVPPSPKNGQSRSSMVPPIPAKTRAQHAASDEGRVSQPQGDSGVVGEVPLWEEDVTEEVPLEEGQHHVPRDSTNVFTTRISDLETSGLHYQQVGTPFFPSHSLKYSMKGLRIKPDVFAHLQVKPRPLMLFDFGNLTGY